MCSSDLALFSEEEHRFGIHAGEIETSMMMALKPESVRMQEAKHFPSAAQDRSASFELLGNGKSAKLGWQMQDYNRDGAVGNAAAASAEKGHTVIRAHARALANLLAEVDRLPDDTVRAL